MFECIHMQNTIHTHYVHYIHIHKFNKFGKILKTKIMQRENLNLYQEINSSFIQFQVT